MTVLLLCVLSFMAYSAEPQDDQAFTRGMAALSAGSFQSVEQGVELIGSSRDSRVETVLKTLLSGELYREKTSGKLVTLKGKEGKQYRIQELFARSGPDSERLVEKRAVKKIAINNRLRGQIKSALALVLLNSSNPSVRRDAVTVILDQLDNHQYRVLNEKVTGEQDTYVRELMQVAIAVYNLSQGSDRTRTASAIHILAASYQPAARNALSRFSAQTDDPTLRRQAEKALAQFEQRARVAEITETLFFGLSLGSVLVLAAIGLAITFGVMGVINMAHGELIMLGAYTTYVVQTLMPEHIGLALVVS